MRLWRKIKLYKNLLLVTLVLNAFLIFTGLSFVVLHYKGRHQAEGAYLESVEQLKALDYVLVQIETLEGVKSWTGREWLKLGELQSYASQAMPQSKPAFNASLDSAAPRLAALKADLSAEKAKIYQKLIEAGSGLGRYREEIFVTAVLSLLLGFVLPTLLLLRLKTQTRKLHAQVETQVLASLKVWRSQSLKHEQQGGMQSPRFWIDIGLLTLAQVTKEIDHPAAVYAHQLAQRFFQEFQAQPSLEEDKENDLEKPGHVS